MRITIKDIAAELRLSPATVSRALSGSSLISEATTAKVRETAARMGYQPNLTARSLRSKHGSALVLILPEINGFFIPEMIFGINAAAREHALPVMMFLSDNKPEREKKLLDYAVQLGAAGVLLSVSGETSDYEHIIRFNKEIAPVVLTDNASDSAGLPGVTINGAAAAEEAVTYLLEMGHRTICGFFGNPQLSISKRRKAGFKKALMQAGIPDPVDFCYDVDHILELPGVFDRFRSHHPECTAIFAMSDELMVHIYHEALRSRLTIPDQLSLISISDGFAPYYLYPNITHIHHSGFEAGYRATQKLAALIQKKETDSAVQELPASLCRLDSVKDYRGE